MAMQVTSCVDMSEANRLPTLNWGTSVAQGITGPANTPIAVAVFYCRNPCYRLLSTTCLRDTVSRGLLKILETVQIKKIKFHLE